MTPKNPILFDFLRLPHSEERKRFFSEFKKFQKELRSDYELLGDQAFWEKYEPLFPTKNLCDDKDFFHRPIVDILREGFENGTLKESMLSILSLGLHTRNKLQKFIEKGKIPDFLIHNNERKSILENKYSWILENPWFLENGWKNYLRILGIIDPINYDAVFKSSGYNLIQEKRPTQFASNLTRFMVSQDPFRSPVSGNILSIGPGPNARDEKVFIENAGRFSQPIDVYINDVSQFVIDTLREEKEKELEKHRFLPTASHLHIEDEPKETIPKLKDMIAKNQKMNCVYSMSVFHHFSNKKLREMFSLIREVLVPGGYLAFAVKVPGTTFDGVGIPIVNRSAQLEAPEEFQELPTPRVWESAWMGLDGQIRTFRDYQTLEKILQDTGFEIISSSRVGIEPNYEFDSQEDDVRFYQFIARKPEN